MMMGTAVLTGTTSCVSDLDQYPHTETTSKDVYTSLANYEAVLGKIYAAMVTSGQGKGGDNKDMESVLNAGSGFDYMRMFINMQECGTDEFASTWLTGEQTTGLTYLSWDANDAWVSDMYYRIYYNIALCNEFLRNANNANFSGADAEKMKEYKAEVRFMRALFYYHALDFYRNIPMVTENDPVGSYIPPRYTPQQTFDYIESELKDCVGDMLPASTCPYGQASQGAAYTLLAKLYLNSEVYTGVAKYAECKEACEKVMDMGYSLESDYSKLFNADNDKRTNEIIFALPVSAEHTVSWGSSTYKELAREHRRQFDIPVIGITGTNGKTTTKELVSAVLAKKYRVLHTEANYNNDVGVPRTLLQITPEHEIAVVEMGASHPGDIQQLVDYVEPTCGMITNVGRAHLEGFGSFEGVKRTKGELYDFMRAHGALLFLNESDADLMEMAAERQFDRVVTYGTDSTADVRGTLISCAPFLHFSFQAAAALTPQPLEVRSQLIGSYNMSNMLAAIAIGLHFGVSPQDAAQALEDYQPSNNRSQLTVTDRNRLIVDAYNANPSSMAAAIENFRLTEADHKMAILGDMRELGEASAEEHQRIVDLLERDGFHDVWLVGPEFAATNTAYRTFPDVEAVRRAIAEELPSGRTILIKGSNGIRLFELPALL